MRFCELCKANEIKDITLLTAKPTAGDQIEYFNNCQLCSYIHRLQRKGLDEIKKSLASHGMTFKYTVMLDVVLRSNRVEFDQALHDREIQFNNGYQADVTSLLMLVDGS